MPLVITKYSPLSSAGVRKKKLLRNHKRQEPTLTLATNRSTVCMLLFFLGLQTLLYWYVCQPSQRLTFIRVGIGTSDQYRSFTHFFSVRFTPFVVYFVVVIYICSSILFRSALEISIFLCSFRTDCFSAVTFDLFPLSMGLLFLPLTQSFSFYDISTFFSSTTTLQS